VAPPSFLRAPNPGPGITMSAGMVTPSRGIAALALSAAAFAAASCFGAVFVPSAGVPAGPEASTPRALRSRLAEIAVAEAVEPEARSAEESKPWSSLAGWLVGGLVMGVVAATSVAPAEAYTQESGFKGVNQQFVPERFSVKYAKELQLCKDSKKFAKIIKNELGKLTQRQNKYPEGSVVWKGFQKKIELVKRRQEAYGTRWCSKTDGRPRTLATPEMVRGGVILPASLFLYSAGWIGWAGRSYLIRSKDCKKYGAKTPMQMEYIINAPLALTCMASGFAWPVLAWQDIVNGKMVRRDEDVHTSGV